MMLDEEMDLGGFLFRELETPGGGIESFQATQDMIVDRHALADVVEEKRENKEIPAIYALPQRLEVCAAGVGRFGKLLEMLDGAERVFVDGVAMVEVANDERIDARKLGKN